MKGGFRQSMAWLHTWSGLVTGWLLFFVFLTGTIGYFDTEVDRWMRPELPLDPQTVSQAEGLALGFDYLLDVAPDAGRWSVYPPNGHDIQQVSVFWSGASGDAAGATERGSGVLDHATGRPLEARETGGGAVLYQMHYVLHYLPRQLGYWIVGVCTMFMLVAIVSGVITHRRIFRDFFTFRPGKGHRSWLDFHNVLSVLALPFHLMITYSGLVFFMITYQALIISTIYGSGGRQAFFDEAFQNPEVPAAVGIAAAPAPLDGMHRQVVAAWGEDNIRSATVYNPGDANARIVFNRGHVDPVSNGGHMVFDAANGTLLGGAPRRSGPIVVNDALLALHEGLFAGPVLRWLYFLTGLLGTAMIGTGLVVWTAKRKPKFNDRGGAPRFGYRLVERLNIGTIAGLPVAVGAYFWANRLLPVDIAARADWEVNVMFIVWAVMLIVPWLRSVRQAWIDEFRAAAAVFLLLPVLNALTTDQHLGASLPAGAWQHAGFDLTILAFGIAFGLAASVLRRRWRGGETGTVSDYAGESVDSLDAAQRT